MQAKFCKNCIQNVSRIRSTSKIACRGFGVTQVSTTPQPSSRARSRPAARAPRPCPTSQPHISRSGIGCGSSHPYRRRERQNVLRSSICGRGRRSSGTCAVAQLADGDRSVGVQCSVCCRTMHRQLAQQGQHRARRSSCDDDDRTRWTDWRSPRSRRFALWARIVPLRTEAVLTPTSFRRPSPSPISLVERQQSSSERRLTSFSSSACGRRSASACLSRVPSPNAPSGQPRSSPVLPPIGGSEFPSFSVRRRRAPQALRPVVRPFSPPDYVPFATAGQHQPS